MIVGYFNTPLLLIDRSSRQKINKETSKLNDIIDQMDMTDVYRVLHPGAAQYTFFLTDRGAFFKIDHISGHKSSLSKYEKIAILCVCMCVSVVLGLELRVSCLDTTT
jgi:exonuclease III